MGTAEIGHLREQRLALGKHSEIEDDRREEEIRQRPRLADEDVARPVRLVQGREQLLDFRQRRVGSASAAKVPSRWRCRVVGMIRG